MLRAFACLLLATFATSPLISRRATPITQDAYVWQRAWTPAVVHAVTSARPDFRRMVLLAAEVRWTANGGHVVTVHTGPVASPFGVAVRIGPGKSIDAKLICDVARAAVANHPAELQLDYDCAESKLISYAALVRQVRSAVAPTPVVVTALPAWLSHPEFADVAAGGFVLQVHSIHAPSGPEGAMTLCDPAEARRAVALASRFGVPFRVALPTYAYVAGFSPSGRLLGLSAEGPPPAWPADTRTRILRSDPTAIAGLVRDWLADPPPNLTGIIWYRLPVDGDALNWRLPTLRAVMAGRAPSPHLKAIATRTEGALFDIALLNDGEADARPADVTVTFPPDVGVVATEPMPGFDRVDSPPGRVTFHAAVDATDRPLGPGQRMPVGWLRLSADREVRADVAPQRSP